MRIAVVGAGISGLVASHLLSARHDVVLIEADSRLGGHAHTVDVSSSPRPFAVETGFVVFNRQTFPNFVRWLGRLGILTQPCPMSFSIRSDERDFEYGSASMNALFSQRRNLVSWRFHRMWIDILRFHREARELLGPGDDMPLGDYLRLRAYSDQFVSDYLLPLVGAVSSSNRESAVFKRFIKLNPWQLILV